MSFYFFRWLKFFFQFYIFIYAILIKICKYIHKSYLCFVSIFQTDDWSLTRELSLSKFLPFAIIISNWYVYKIVLCFTIFNIFTHHEHPLGNKGWYVDHKANKYHKISINRCSKTIYIAGGIFHLCPTYFTHMYIQEKPSTTIIFYNQIFRL